MNFLMDPRVAGLLAGRFFEGVSTGLLMMALPWLLLKEGDNGSFVALIALLCTLSSFCLTPVFATAIDRYSRKSILIGLQWAQAVAALSLLMLFLAGYQINDIQGLVVIIFTQLVFWISGDVSWNTTGALVQENFSKEEYPRISAFQEVLMQGVMLMAGAGGIFLLESWNLAQFALFACVVSSLAAFSYRVMPYTRQLSVQHPAGFRTQLMDTRRIFLKQPRWMLFLAMSCLSYPVLMFLVKLVPVYLAEQNVGGEWFAIWKSSYGLGAMICGFVITMLLLRFRPEWLMSVSVLVIAVVIGIMAVAASPEVIVLMTLLVGFCNATNRISRMNKMNLSVEVGERGRIDGGLKMFSTLMQSLGYMLIALLAAHQATVYGFAIIACVMGVAGLLMYVWQAQESERSEVSTLDASK